jgi:hypothetical protein
MPVKTLIWISAGALALAWTAATAFFAALAGWLAAALASGEAAEWARLVSQWPPPPWVALWIDPAQLQALQATLVWAWGWIQAALPVAGTLVSWLVPLVWVGWFLGLVALVGSAALGHLWWSRRRRRASAARAY